MKMNNIIELLSPVGDFNCLKAAVQNGANSVYFGANAFNARYSATNFNLEDLKQAIQYAKIRNVKTHLTLNTLIKNEEFNSAIELATFAYENGIDAIIVQDLGLAQLLIKNFPDLPIHASTQMTIHNLQGALEAEDLGFKRAVLSRELTIDEIKNICKNTSIEIETFIHGALCISYSGQCLLSSIIGARSGNRGKCAQPCRLPYTLMNNNQALDKGYLLSTRDLCGLEFIPELINAGVKCFKIEGRMKPPEYVATVTRIYRKYIGLALSDKPYIIDEQDKTDLLQVFNRGGFSNGHLNTSANKDLIYPNKPNNMGLYLGKVHNYNVNKGNITLKLSTPLSIGDTISLEKESGTYTISELMIDGKNISSANIGDIVKIGRMKGNIHINDRIYKISDKILFQNARKTFSDTEFKKIPLNCNVYVKTDMPIQVEIYSLDKHGFYKDINFTYTSNVIPVNAINSPITADRIIAQINKTGNTPYEFKSINVELDDNLYIPSISCLNEIRRFCIDKLQSLIIEKYCLRNIEHISIPSITTNSNNNSTHTISILLNRLNLDYNYELLQNVDNVYIPLKYFLDKQYTDILTKICNNFNVYVYLPIIYKNSNINFDNILETFKITGFVLSNISHLNLIKIYNNYKFVANYSFNIYNNYTVNSLENSGLDTITISPELDKESIYNLLNTTNNYNKELIVYGKLPIMNINYCLLGKSNKCYTGCKQQCSSNDFYLKDRLGLKFQIIPDKFLGITTIYNCKTTSINLNSAIPFNFRADFIDEDINEMQNIIDTILSGNRLEGKEYTNGNFNKLV